MLDSFERYVLVYDVTLRTARKATEFPPLSDLAPVIVTRVNEGKSRIELPAYDGTEVAPWLRIKKARIDKLSGHSYLQLLLSVGDPRAANPAFEHSETAKLRTVVKLEKEGKALTAHCTIRLAAASFNRHRLVVEDVRGLGRTRVQELLAHELKAISREYELEYTNALGEQVQTHIIAELEGHRSEKIISSLKRGTLAGVWLIDSQARASLDEVEGASVVRRELKLDVRDKSLLPDVAKWGAEKQYDRMRLVWSDPEGAGKPERASVDTTQGDVQNNYFVKQYKITLSKPLDEAVEELRDDVLQEMRKQMPA